MNTCWIVLNIFFIIKILKWFILLFFFAIVVRDTDKFLTVSNLEFLEHIRLSYVIPCEYYGIFF